MFFSLSGHPSQLINAFFFIRINKNIKIFQLNLRQERSYCCFQFLTSVKFALVREVCIRCIKIKKVDGAPCKSCCISKCAFYFLLTERLCFLYSLSTQNVSFTTSNPIQFNNEKVQYVTKVNTISKNPLPHIFINTQNIMNR